MILVIKNTLSILRESILSLLEYMFGFGFIIALIILMQIMMMWDSEITPHNHAPARDLENVGLIK